MLNLEHHPRKNSKPWWTQLNTDLDKKHVTTCENWRRKDAHRQLALVAFEQVALLRITVGMTKAGKVIKSSLVPHLGVFKFFYPLDYKWGLRSVKGMGVMEWMMCKWYFMVIKGARGVLSRKRTNKWQAGHSKHHDANIEWWSCLWKFLEAFILHCLMKLICDV